MAIVSQGGCQENWRETICLEISFVSDSVQFGPFKFELQQMATLCCVLGKKRFGFYNGRGSNDVRISGDRPVFWGQFWHTMNIHAAALE